MVLVNVLAFHAESCDILKTFSDVKPLRGGLGLTMYPLLPNQHTASQSKESIMKEQAVTEPLYSIVL